MPENDEKPIGLQELIQKVKRDLLSDLDETQPLFLIEKLELEIAFTVERTAGGGIDVKVFQGNLEKSWGQVQKVKITLDPILERDDIFPDLTAGEKHIAEKALHRGDQDID